MSSPSVTGVQELQRRTNGFRSHLRQLREAQTLEATIRVEYIDEFWKALGWDVGNRDQRSPAEKDVAVEPPVYRIEEEGIHLGRPDYLFRISGFSRFIVEAKKVFIDIATDRDAIFQAKCYAWSAQIPFAILTNFERFRLFDATLKPYYADPGRGVIADFDLRFEDYQAQWDVLWNTFGRDAVAGGSLEKLLAKIKRVRSGQRVRGIDRMLFDLRGTEPVGRDFLAHLEDYRLRFAREIYHDNRKHFPDADTLHGAAKLTEACQRLIDRLVFVRVCEDREITARNGLKLLLNEASENDIDFYGLLLEHFRQFDRQYNGYLFRPHFSEELTISPHLLADFVRSLYPPDAPYQFSMIGDDLLGIIYERFLGRTITVTHGQVEAEEKPEVLHAGGVYYTPRFVVNSIVRRVVGPKIQGKTPQEVLGVKILDPASGSGSFLIAAFQFLMDHCVDYITKDHSAAEVPASPSARKKKHKIAFQQADGTWELRPEFRSQLLASCIHGVDIDAQAVEVTVMSLYLKTLERKLPPSWQREWWLDTRLLPSLENNIRCGNSLLSQSDFEAYWQDTRGQIFTTDEDIVFRLNAFDWKSSTRGFGRLLDNRGFDCIIGNPPYIRVQELNRWAPEECGFYKWQYHAVAVGSYDIYIVFFQRCLDLLAEDGLLGFICPHKFWQAKYGQGLRRILAEGEMIRSLVDFTDQQVFHGATIYTAIQVLTKGQKSKVIDYARVNQLTDGDAQCRSIDIGESPLGVERFMVSHPEDDRPWFFHPPVRQRFLESLENAGVALCPGVCSNVFQGIVTGADDIFLSGDCKPVLGNQALVRFHSDATGLPVEIEKEMVVPVVRREGFQSYVALSGHALILPHDANGRLYDQKTMANRFTRTWDYLGGFKKRLEAREDGRFRDYWWSLSRPQNIERWRRPKILIPYMINRLQAVWDVSGSFFVNVTTGGYGLELRGSDLPFWHLYVVGLLNSKLLDYYLRQKSSHFHGGYFPANKQFVENIPVKIPANPGDRKVAEEIAERASRIAEAKAKLMAGGLGDQQRERLERDVGSNEERIDILVMGLYDIEKLPGC
jgi:hypothetical protein